jgi:hypothetical protein
VRLDFKLLPFAGEGEIFFAAESIVVTLILSDVSDADADFLASFYAARPETKFGCACEIEAAREYHPNHQRGVAKLLLPSRIRFES